MFIVEPGAASAHLTGRTFTVTVDCNAVALDRHDVTVYNER